MKKLNRTKRPNSGALQLNRGSRFAERGMIYTFDHPGNPSQGLAAYAPTLVGTPAYRQIGGLSGVQLGATADYVDLGTHAEFNPTTFTQLAIIRLESLPGIITISETLLSTSSSTGSGQFRVDGSGRLGLVHDNIIDISTATSAKTVQVGQIHVVAVSYDGTTANMAIDGVDVSNTSVARTVSTGRVGLGSKVGGSSAETSRAMQFFLYGYWGNRYMSKAELVELTRNPWQLFLNAPKYVFPEVPPNQQERVTASETQSAIVSAVASIAEAGSAVDSGGDAHRYWRLYCISNNGSTYTSISEIEMRGVANGADLCSGGTVTASGETGGAEQAAYAFDNNTSTQWAVATARGAWIQYDFGSGNPVNIAEYTVKHRPDCCGDQGMNAWRLEFSDDGATWGIADARSNQTWSLGETKTMTVPRITEVYRIESTANQSGAYTGISEIELRASIGGADQCTGGTAATRSFTNNSERADLAFDDSNSTQWVDDTSGTTWIQYMFPSAITLAQYGIRARSSSTEQTPKNWTLQKSTNRGLTWTAVDTQTNQTGWSASELRTFSVAMAHDAATAESATAVETVTGAVDTPAAQAESGSAVESSDSILVLGATTSDTGSAADTSSAVSSAVAAGSDAGSLTDSTTATSTTDATLSDSMSAVDGGSASVSAVGATAESVTATDAYGATTSKEADQQETLTIVDEIVGGTLLVATWADAMSATDLTGGSMAYVADQTEQASSADTQNAGLLATADTSDTLTAIDNPDGFRYGVIKKRNWSIPGAVRVIKWKKSLRDRR